MFSSGTLSYESALIASYTRSSPRPAASPVETNTTYTSLPASANCPVTPLRRLRSSSACGTTVSTRFSEKIAFGSVSGASYAVFGAAALHAAKSASSDTAAAPAAAKNAMRRALRVNPRQSESAAAAARKSPQNAARGSGFPPTAKSRSARTVISAARKTLCTPRQRSSRSVCFFSKLIPPAALCPFARRARIPRRDRRGGLPAVFYRKRE